MNNTDLNQFSRRVEGDKAIYEDVLLFRAGAFPERVVNGQPLEVTADHLQDVERSFNPFTVRENANSQHTNWMKGQRPDGGYPLEVRSVRAVGDELRGTAAMPLWLDENLHAGEKQISVEFDPDTFRTLTGIALCTNPRITGAQLMTWQTEFAAKKENEMDEATFTQRLVDSFKSMFGMSPDEAKKKLEQEDPAAVEARIRAEFAVKENERVMAAYALQGKFTPADLTKETELRAKSPDVYDAIWPTRPVLAQFTPEPVSVDAAKFAAYFQPSDNQKAKEELQKTYDDTAAWAKMMNGGSN